MSRTATHALHLALPLGSLLFLLGSSAVTAQTATPLRTVRVAAGLAAPLWAGSPPGRDERLFILEQNTGLIKILKRGTVLPTPFLNVRTLILTGGERGLLGLAFHPRYAANGYFYVNYTRAGDGATMVVRFNVSASNPDVADPNSAFTIIGPITQPYSNHNGGCVTFGPDGYLYIGMGDGGSAGDPACNAQRGDTLLGKMLRIDVDGGSPYRNPPTNPFLNDPNWLDEIWSFGWRNPWRFSFDRMNGDMYVGDVGQGAREEISFQAGNSTGGGNYGWKIMEGTACYSTASCPATVPPCNDPRLILPIHEYTHSSGNCSVTGGFVYRGCAIPDLRGTYFFADYCTARIWSLRYANGRVTDLTDRTTELAPGGGLAINSITSFGEDWRGEVYIVDGGGEVFKIVPGVTPPTTDLGFGKVGSNGLVPEFTGCGLLDAGKEATFLLQHAPPSTPCALLISSTVNPQPIWGGTVAPWPVEFAVPLMTSAAGTHEFLLPGGMGSFVLNGQYLLRDVGASFDAGFSNALRVQFLP
jgi:glucose/arabinose dehydrogenase